MVTFTCPPNKVGGTRPWYLWRETESLFATVIHIGISICVRFIPGKVNVIADNLSRAGHILPTEWSLHQDMVSPPRHSQPCLQHLGTTQHRPVCDIVQPQVLHICVANTQCQIPQYRCSDNRLGGDVCLCLSSPTNPTSGPEEVPAKASLHSASHSTILAKAELVPGPSDSVRKNLHPSASL